MAEYPSYEDLSIEKKAKNCYERLTVVTANLSALQIEIRLIVDELTNRISK
jgi:hypothetical protein